jgi:dTMP kinase
MSKGKFIVIEGTDGSGKGTQFAELQKRLTNQDVEFETFDFPQYGQPSAYFVEQYLNGEYGTPDDIGPYRGSTYYAMDRYQASFKMREALEAGKWVIANRYVGSNMGHQGGKIADEEERKKYFTWLDDFEFSIMGIPKPDLNVVLHMPAEKAQKLVDQKAQREYLGDKKRDIHEDDLNHLKNAVKVYSEITELFPETFTKIECMDGDKLLSISEVSDLIWQNVEPLLN